jgi:hypothetical protein
MAARWGQENYFKDARDHFALDALDSYADPPTTRPGWSPTRQGPCRRSGHRRPTPGRRRPSGVAEAIDAAGIRARQPGNGGKATVDPAAGQALTAAATNLAVAKATSATTASHLPLGQVRPGSRLLETERKLLTHAIRMSAYNVERALARLLRPPLRPHADDQARALLREAFTLSRDLRSPATPCTSGSTPPRRPDAERPRRAMHRTHRHRDPLPRLRPDPRLHRQRRCNTPGRTRFGSWFVVGTITTAGMVLAVIWYRTGWLGMAICTHVLFNASGVTFAILS